MHRQARPIRQPETLPSTTHDERLGRHRFKQLDKHPNMYVYIYIYHLTYHGMEQHLHAVCKTKTVTFIVSGPQHVKWQRDPASLRF